MKLPHHFKLLPLVGLLLTMAAQAQLPTGMTVVAGQATAQQSGKQLTINNISNTILNWQSFSIGAANSVRFVQPSSTSQVLNRVTGNDLSAILGSLSSNGHVWLLNPNGVLFGQGARIDVASLVTSTLNIANSDWLSGRALFTGGGAAGSVVNQGEIRTTSGGRVALIGSSVSNEGLISAPNGQIVLAAGQSVELVDTGAPNLAVKLTAPTGSAFNLGTLSGGRVDVLAAAVNQQGIVEAQSIVLQADGRLTLVSGSSTRADGEQGGNIKLLGQTIELQDSSAVSANGNSGGGTVLVGGGAQGQDASVPNAQGVYFAPGASISADALVNGNGGHIVLWADQATRAFGSLSAHAGVQGGNGGLIETSGHWLDARPAHLDVSAAAGKAGTWLLDPYDITISDAVSDSNFDASFTATGNSATISTSTIETALTNGNSVTISTSSGGGQAGNITLTAANIYVSPSVGVALTLNAAADITADSTIISNSYYAPLTVIFNAGLTTAGAVSLNNTTITTSDGSIALNGSGHPGLPDGVKLAGTTISTNTGNITINGSTGEAGGRGVAMDPGGSGNSLSSQFATITGSSTLGTGVQIRAAQITESSNLTINGTGGGNGLELSYFGANSPLRLSANDIVLNGSSTGSNYGVLIDFSGASSGGTGLSASAAGGTALRITGSNSAGNLQAVALLGSTQDYMLSVGTSSVSLNATGGGMLLKDVSTNDTVANFSATSDSSLVIDGGYISTDSQSRIGLHAHDITLQGALTLSAGAASGTAIIVNGADSSGPAQTFDNKAGPQVLLVDTSSGARFILYVANATDSASFNLGGIPYDFQRYGAVNGASDWSGDSGNGIVSYQGQTVSYTGTVDPRAYDGSLSASISNVQVVPGVSGDQQSVAGVYTGTFGDKNAGTGKTVLLSIVQAPAITDSTGHPVYGYNLSGTLTGDITPAVLTANVTAANKVYDATTTATMNVSNVLGLVGSETVGVSATGNFSDKNVGTGKLVTAGYVLSDGSNGGLASNYQFSGSEIPPADITPAPITFTATALNKVYDTTINATVNNIGITPLGSDQLTVNAGSALFSDKNVGTAKTVFLSGFSLGGADAANYTLQNPVNLTADITPAPISFTATAQNKAYDGTTTATLVNIGFRPLGSDAVTLNNGSAAFADKNAGTAKNVNTSGFSLSGLDAGNYQLSAPVLVADITPAVLSGTVTVANKVYDGTATATVSVSGVTGLIGSETVAVSGLGNFSDKNVGSAKPIAASYQIGNGANGGLASNYRFSPPANNPTADITPATLVYAANAAQLQSGAPLPTFTGSVSGFVGGDTQGSATTGSLAFVSGTSSTAVPGSYAINGQGLSATNYQFVQAAGNATALTIVGGGPAETQAQSSTVPVSHVQPAAPQPSNPQSTGMVDMTVVPTITASSGGTSASFDSVPVSDMSPSSLAGMLGARAGFMQQLLGNGLGQLAQNPGLADAVPCKSLKEAAAGTCLVTETLKLQAKAEAGTAVPLPQAPGGPGTAAPASAPTAPTAPVLAAAPAPVLPLFNQRRIVKVAALPEIRRKVAVLIGEGQYQDASIPALANSVGDAHAVAATLNQQLGYETLVLDNPSKEMVISTLNRLALETGPQDSVVVYYAGHGAQVDSSGQGYWLMSNSDPANAKTWLSNADIGRLIQQIDARQVALISDSCYSGALVGGSRIRATPGSAAVKPSELLAKRSTVVMSSGGNEPVFDSGRGGHSLFAWTLMDNLGKVKDWQLGGNVFERVRFAVARELPQRPQYGAAAGNADGGDYLFEMRQLDAASSSAPGAE